MPDDLSSRGETNQLGEAAVADDTSLFPSIDEPPDGGASQGDLSRQRAAPVAAEPARLDLVLNIPVRLSVELGRAELPIREVVNIDRGSVIGLDRSVGQPLDVRVNGVLIGHGEIVVVDEERLGLRFVDVVSQAERVTRLT
jgi:flagellar motor switch protein FliN/FliY